MQAGKSSGKPLNKQACQRFVSELRTADTLAMFHNPVDPRQVIGYDKVITNPMDLSTIGAKIEGGKYNCDADVEDDVALMISNALEFNERGSRWHDLASRFRRMYHKLAVSSGLDVDDDNAFIPAKRAKDDESTLSKAERHCNEKLDVVLTDLEKDKEVPLEELRARYAHKDNEATSDRSASCSQIDSDSDDEDDEDDDSVSSSTNPSDASSDYEESAESDTERLSSSAKNSQYQDNNNDNNNSGNDKTDSN